MNHHECLGCSAMNRRDFLKCACGALAAAPVMATVSQARDKIQSGAPLAMWALTGRLPSDEVRRQLDLFRAARWGVVLYPRSGLELEYLGEAWFERLRFVVEQAAQRQVEVWIYDEFNWPSGQAKGQVAGAGGRCLASALRVAADGRSEVATLPHTAGLLDITATRRFLEATHERYAKALGEFFGATVRAIFTDEPSLPEQHRGGLSGAGYRWAVPWSGVLAEALGGDFPQRLAAAKDPADPALWRPYWAAYADTFESQWARPIAAWCAAHGLALTGHLLGEGSLGSQVAYYGSLMRQLAHFHLPGIDEINTRVEVDACEALTLATISRFPGRERMAEVYAYGPSSMTFGKMNQMLDLLAACGVNRYVLAICPFDFRGSLLKRDYLNTCGVQQPWFREAARVYTDYADEAAARARQAQPFALDWPSDEELWAIAGPDPKQSKPLSQLTQKLSEAAREILRQRLPQPPPAKTAGHRPLVAAWNFRLAEANSLRLDARELQLDFVPPDAELSVQRQLVPSLRINGKAVDLDGGRPDTRYDISYTRLPIAPLLRAGINRFDADSAEKKPLRFLPHLILWGNFAVNAQGRIVKPASAVELGDWRLRGYPQLCGAGIYTTSLEPAMRPRRLELDTGGYPVRVTFNGAGLGLRAWAPFVFNLPPSRNRSELEVRVIGTVGHLVDPQHALPIGLLGAWILNA